jgi:hypothetical protein
MASAGFFTVTTALQDANPRQIVVNIPLYARLFIYFVERDFRFGGHSFLMAHNFRFQFVKKSFDGGRTMAPITDSPENAFNAGSRHNFDRFG